MMKLNANEKNLLRKNLNLSERQAQIVELLLDGIDDTEEIAHALGISPSTVKTILHIIYKKTRKTSRVQLVIAAIDAIQASNHS